VAPLGPDGPAEPVAPVAPDGPEGPVAPLGPEGPDGPDGPEGPDGPDGPVEPVGPAIPVAPDGPDGPVGPVGPVGAVTVMGSKQDETGMVERLTGLQPTGVEAVLKTASRTPPVVTQKKAAPLEKALLVQTRLPLTTEKTPVMEPAGLIGAKG